MLRHLQHRQSSSDIANFEMGLSTAQAQDNGVGSLRARGATGGPQALADELFFVGVNDPVGLNPHPISFTSKIFNLFDTWEDAAPRRRAIYRGETVFNTKTFSVSDVAGLNGATFSSGVTVAGAVVSTTCGICHDTPNVGNHSVSAPLNIGVADAPGGRNVLDVRYLPVITICQRPALTTCVNTTDPGRAMISGSFADIGKFKGPILRGLAACTIFPQRKRPFIDGCCRFLRFPFQHRFYFTRKIRSRCLSQVSLSRLRRFALHSF